MNTPPSHAARRQLEPMSVIEPGSTGVIEVEQAWSAERSARVLARQAIIG